MSSSHPQPVLAKAIGDAVRPGKKPFWRLPMCALKLCGHRANSDELGVWGECDTCHQRAGYVTRADLRSYIEREEAALAALHREWDAEFDRPDGALRADTAFERHALTRYLIDRSRAQRRSVGAHEAPSTTGTGGPQTSSASQPKTEEG